VCVRVRACVCACKTLKDGEREKERYLELLYVSYWSQEFCLQLGGLC
jgi:hypothetical protein